MGGISIWQLAIVLVIILLLFGTKKLRNVGGDLGSAIKSFKKAVKEDEVNAELEKNSDDNNEEDNIELKAKAETINNRD